MYDIEINNKLIKSVEKIGFSGVNLDSKFSDIGLDSLDLVEFIMNLESNFNIEISDFDADGFTRESTIKNVKEYLRKKHNIRDIRLDRKEKIISINEIKKNSK